MPKHKDQSEIILVKEVLNDIKAFDKLYILYVDKIYNYCFRRVSNEDIASDLTSEIFLKVFKVFDEGKYKLDERFGFGPWIYRIAHNLVVDHYKYNAKRKTVDLDKVSNILSEDDLNSVDLRLDLTDKFSQVAEIIKDLDDDIQTIFVLKFSDDYSFKKIGETLNLNESTIKMKYYRSIEYIKKHSSNEI